MERGGAARRREPLVSPAAVRRWATAVGLQVGEGGIDRPIVELYVEHVRTAGEGAEDGTGPVPCPRCGRAGFIDHIDLAAGLQIRCCTPCGVSWSASLAAEATAGP
jgi:hypothetical protein